MFVLSRGMAYKHPSCAAGGGPHSWWDIVVELARCSMMYMLKQNEGVHIEWEMKTSHPMQKESHWLTLSLLCVS